MFLRTICLMTLPWALFALGCGDGLCSLEGTVTIDGKPAGEGIALQFQPISSGSPSYAKTDSEGHYVAEFTHRRKGIQPGKHRVSLVPGSSVGGMEQIPDTIDGELSAKPVPTSEAANAKATLPSRYFGEIMTITVEPGSNSIDIPLETESPAKKSSK